MKTLTIRDKVYKELLKLKRKDESFSELLKRLATEKKHSITEFAGFLTESEAEKMRRDIYENRKKNRLLIKRGKMSNSPTQWHNEETNIKLFKCDIIYG